MKQYCSKLAAALLLSFFLFSLNAHAVTVLEPGESVVLQRQDMPLPVDGTDASCVIFPVTSLGATCGTDQAGQQFGVRASAGASFNRGQGTASQFYEIEVDEGDGSETALLAQISGKANFNGFLALVGGGQVAGTLKLRVIDLGRTDDPDLSGGKVVHQETLANHQLQGVAITGLNFGFTVEGGAPYIGVGASPEFKVNIALKKELVRDKIDFGLHVLLLRGHTYRLQFEMGALAKNALVSGLSIAQFKLGDDRAPNMLDPEHWLDGIDGMLDTKVPDITAKAMNIKKETAIDSGVFGFWPRKRILSEPRGASGTSQLLGDSGLPTSLREIVENRLKKSSILTEGIARPGVEVRELSVTLQTDQVEILRRHTELLKHIIDLQNTPQGRRPEFPLQ